jgi:uncharacterized protein (DUF924 family)
VRGSLRITPHPARTSQSSVLATLSHKGRGEARVMRVGELNLRVPMTQDAERISKPLDVLAFWRAAGPDKWFERDDGFDADVRARFLATCAAAAQGRLDDWQGTPDGVLALLILLDQFPRNLFRDDARAFATDAQAREIAERAIARGFDRMFGLPERRFFYTPLMHSENLADQERCIALCRAAGDVEGVKYAELHVDVIRRFGRFPHRNRALGRATTDEERAFLDAGSAGFGA